MRPGQTIPNLEYAPMSASVLTHQSTMQLHAVRLALHRKLQYPALFFLLHLRAAMQPRPSGVR